MITASSTDRDVSKDVATVVKCQEALVTFVICVYDRPFNAARQVSPDTWFTNKNGPDT